MSYPNKTPGRIHSSWTADDGFGNLCVLGKMSEWSAWHYLHDWRI